MNLEKRVTHQRKQEKKFIVTELTFWNVWGVMQVQLYKHQQSALKSTEKYNRCAYYLDMGLGKTYVGSEKMHQLNAKVNLIVCQKSKVNDWVIHMIQNYAMNHGWIVYDLTKKEDLQMFMRAVDLNGDHDPIVGVINYDLLYRRPYFSHMTGFTLMLDESSIIQNETAKRTEFILKMQPDNVILLSGTPTAGKYERLWSQLQLLGWGISKKLYYKQYVEQEWIGDKASGFGIPIITGYKNVERLKQKLAEHGAIFMKSEEAFDLPAQQDITIKLSTTKEYRKFMKDRVITVDTKNLCEFKDDSDYYGRDTTPRVQLIGDTSLTERLYARQLCGQYSRAKLEAFRDVLESTNDRLIVFYNFKEELNKLEQIAKQYTDHISTVNGELKDLAAYDQYEDSITFVQYQAGAMGLNLQKANKIVYFTLTDKSELFEQSKKRIHRIGQEKPCFYYYLMCKGSVEENILETLKLRRDYTDALFEKYTSESSGSC